jgi:MFS family permease
MLGVLRRRNFALLWLGGLVSMAGDWMLYIALPFYVYEISGSTLATGAMFMAETLPRVLLGTMAGVFVDRWDRRLTMIVADVLRAALLLLLLLVRTVDQLWIVYLVAFAEAAISQFFNLAVSALLPRLVDEKQLLRANSLNAATGEAVRLSAPALGGALMEPLGFGGLVLLDAASYAISAVMVLLIFLPRKAEMPGPLSRATSPQPVQTSTDPAVLAGWSSIWSLWKDWLSGLHLVKGDRLVAGLFLVMGVVMVGQGIINALLVAFVKESLHGGARELGWLASAQGVGGLAGALLVGRLGSLLPPPRLIAGGSVETGLLIAGIAHSGSLWPALPLVALVGLPAMVGFVPVHTLLQQGVPDRYRGRVFGAFNTTNALLTLLGLGLGGTLGDLLGPVLMLTLAGGLHTLAGVLALGLPQHASGTGSLAGAVSEL